MNPLRFISLFIFLSIVSSTAHAADVIVMISGGFKSTYEALEPGFEKMTGSHLVLVPGPSEGSTKEAIPNRLARGEVADVLIMVGPALDKLVAFLREGKKPEPKTELLTPITITKENLDKAERLDEMK